MTVPPLDTVTRVVQVLQDHGLRPALGGSGLLVALGLADTANDWDLTVDAAESVVTAALDDAEFRYHDATVRDGIYGTQRKFVIDAGDHTIDLMVDFAIRGPSGVEQMPTRVSGSWNGLPLADPAVWARAYQLMNRPAKADALHRWLASR